MNDLSVTDLRRIQFLASNYSRLQGLRMLPIGLLLVFVTWWTNRHTGPNSQLEVPILVGVLCAGLFWLIDRYYRRAFGRAIDKTHSRLIDWAIGAVGVITVLIAFWIDSRYTLPVNLTGLVVAVAMLSDYLRLFLLTRTWYAPFTPAFALLVGLASVLPLFGLREWWLVLGIQTEMLAIFLVAGLVMITAGLASHVYFLRYLPGEAAHGRRI